MSWFRRKEKTDPVEVSRALRAQALELEAAAGGFAPSEAHPNVWGIIMETGYPEAVATLVAFTDGTTSLYFSSGGGVIGGGEHAEVRATLPGFFSTAESARSHFTATTDTPLPAEGRVRFYIRTFAGTMTAEADEEDLGEMRHDLSPLFHAAHEVIFALRQMAGG